MVTGIADAAIEQAQWEPSKYREKLGRDIDAHVASVRAAKLSELIAQYEVFWSFFFGLNPSFGGCEMHIGV